MQCCIVNGNVALFVGRVNPRSQLGGECGFSLVEASSVVDLSKLFIVIDEDFHFDKVVVKGGKVKEGSIVFVGHDAEVELGVFLEVVFEIFERPEASDLIDRFIHVVILYLLIIYTEWI